MSLPLPDDWSPMLKDVQAAYPNEGCGVLLRGPSGVRVRPMRNAYGELKARSPAQYPRTARTAFGFDPKEWLRVSQEADARGEEVAAVYHSHADVGAYLSSEDRAMAAPGGDPLLPGVVYLVLAVNRGRTEDARLYAWVGKDFTEQPLPKDLRERLFPKQ